jgi:ubiquinone biosynthesis protein COQ9
MPNPPDTPTDRLLRAILPHVAFDGWSTKAFSAALAESGLSEAEALAAAPRGAIDLAIAFHRAGDRAMLESLAAADLSEMRFRDKVAAALRYRVEAMDDREAVRRASALFALPQHAPEGAKLVWETADHIWTALGDTSRDVNWYTKRATLSGVWASTVLYWLGDQSPGAADTFAFIDRRIDNVMQIEKAKAGLRKNPLTKPLMDLQSSILSRVRAPDPSKLDNLPGRWTRPN